MVTGVLVVLSARVVKAALAQMKTFVKVLKKVRELTLSIFRGNAF